MPEMTKLGDGLTNLVSQMGTLRDKAAGTAYTFVPLNDQQIASAYRGGWLARKVVDIPPFDACRNWRDWQAEGDAIETVEAEENRLNVRGKVLEAMTKGRLWGGAAIYIGTADANPGEPLDPAAVGAGGLKYLTVLTRRSLSAGDIVNDATSEWYGRPGFYRVLGAGNAAVPLNIHPSRLVLFTGAAADEDGLWSVNGGWGDSILQGLLDTILRADGTSANIASLVFEAKVNVVRVHNFMQQLGDPRYEELLLKRFSAAAAAKGINGDYLLDKEDEFETKNANFGGLPEIMNQFLQMVSGGADIPATRFLGQSPAGLSATGESDLRNYYDRISAIQTLEIAPAMRRLDECLIRSATGSRDPSIYYEWAPLYGLSDTEKATIFKTKADAARALAGGQGQQPLMPIEALSDALVNTFVEDGSLPGLEAAIEEFGRLAEQEEAPEDQAAALTPDPANDDEVTTLARKIKASGVTADGLDAAIRQALA